MNKITMYPLRFSTVATRMSGRSFTLRLFTIEIKFTVGKPPWVKYYWPVHAKAAFIKGPGIKFKLTVRPFEARWQIQRIATGPHRWRRIWRCPNCNHEASASTFKYSAEQIERETAEGRR